MDINTLNSPTPYSALDQMRSNIEQGANPLVECCDAINLFVDEPRRIDQLHTLVVKDKLLTEKQWTKAMHRLSVTSKLGFYPQTCDEFIKQWTTANRITVKPNGGIQTNGPVKVLGQLHDDSSDDPDGLLKVAIANKRRENESYSVISRDLKILAMELRLQFDRQLVEMCLDKWIDEQKSNARIELYVSVKKQPTHKSDVMWLNLFKAVADPDKITPDVGIAVLKKIIWQVKRKMICEDISNHLMVIFYGKQGVGKSVFIELFTRPMKDMRAYTTCIALTDDRNINLFTDHYVLVLDEMAHAAKTEMEALKRTITCHEDTKRIMRENKSITFINNATLIGSTNKKLSQSIQDETGSRRFFEFPFTDTPNFALLNSIDITQLWQSVDENGPDPTLPYADEIKAMQKPNSMAGPVAEWAESFVGSTKIGISKTDLYEHYKKWVMDYYPKKVFDLRQWQDEMRRMEDADKSFRFKWVRLAEGMRWKLK